MGTGLPTSARDATHATHAKKRPRLPVALLAGALAFCSLTTTAAALELPELAAQAKPAVVLLTVLDTSGRKIGTGTGFFISADGRVVTNYHVIEGGADVRITLSSGKDIRALGILVADEIKDIAILKADGDAFPSLPLGDTKTVRAGDGVVVIGSPRGLSGTLSEGIVSAIREDGLGIEDERADLMPADKKERLRAWSIQITAAVSPGSSGSPIMTRNGEVIGVAVGIRSDGQSLNFGVPIDVPKALLTSLGPDANPQPFTTVRASSSQRNFIISGAVFGALILGFWAWARMEKRRDRRPPKSGGRARLKS